MTRLGAWVQASRPLAQIAVAPPLVYGQALAWALHGTFRWSIAAFVQLFGLCVQLFVVYANDIADIQSDEINTTFNRYSGGSRVIPEGKITPMHLAYACTLALFATGAVAAHLVFREQRAWLVVLTAIAAHLTWMYGFPPFRLSSRGHGEVLQGLGVGLLLPVVAFYAQAGTLFGLPPAALFPGFLLGYAGNVTLGLADTPSDRASNRRSHSVRRGERAARRTSVALVAIAALATPLATPGAPLLVWLPVVVVAGAALAGNVPRLDTADSSDRVLCERFTARNLFAIAAVQLAWAAALCVR